MAGSSDRAIARIRDLIVEGELPPGQRLPPEKELAEALGVSRNALREAVKALELVRVLDARQGDGTYVTSLEAPVLSEALAFILDLHRDDSLLEIFEVRRMLEPRAAALAASRIDDATLRILDDAVAAVDPAGSVDDLVAHDLTFHRTISAASGNGHLAGLLDALNGATVRARTWRGVTQGDVVQVTVAEHRGILEALRAHDAEGTRALAEQHIEGIEAWLRRAL